MFAAVALLGCSNESTPVAPDATRAISFGTVDTRANITTGDIESAGFGVYAFVSTGEGSNIYEHLLGNEDGAKSVYKDVEGNWTYDDVKFWLGNRTYQFFGIYPNDASYSITKDISGNPTGISRVFTTPDEADEDLVLAQTTIDTSESTPTSVDMNFQHMLSKVSLNVWRNHGKHQNDQMRVRKVTLSNIRKVGTLSTASNTWSYTNDKLKMEYVNNDVTDNDNIGAAVITDGSWSYSGDASKPFSELMLLPQTLDASNNSVSLKIVYELKRQNAADWEEKELETMLPSMTLNPGQRYTFNVVLSSVTDITVYYIQTKVDPWGTPQVGGTVIIK